MQHPTHEFRRHHHGRSGPGGGDIPFGAAPFGGRGRRGGFGGGPGGPGGGPGGRGGHGHGRGRGGGGGGGWQQSDLPATDDTAAWLTGRLPDGWFVGAPQVTIDREEITVIGELPPVEGEDSPAAAAGRITRFREDTRDERMVVDSEAQAKYGRSIAWGARIGATEQVFSNQSVPVMTRLRQPERRVLDTLVDSGVARSRSDALVWCVRLVGEHADDWLGQLREAMTEVDRLRTDGPEI